MEKRTTRAYNSEIRAKQAEQTRSKILLAARALFRTKGYDKTAIEAIAKKAGVATPTVYTIFGSKKDILRSLVDTASFGEQYREAVKKVKSATNPSDALRLVSGVARAIHDSARSEIDLFRGAGVVSPEIAAVEKEQALERYGNQKAVIDLLFESKSVKKGLSEKKARDILWSLTDREVYKLLVVDRGWSSDQYEAWLGELLNGALLKLLPFAGDPE